MLLKSKTPRAKQKISITPRERNLFAIGAWGFAFIAVLFLFNKYSAARAELAKANDDITNQQIVLDQKDEIDARLAEHAQRMETTKTIEGSELQSLVETLAQDAQLIRDSINTKTTKPSHGVQLLTVTIAFRDATMDRLLKFEDRLRDAKIPLTVESTSLTANARDFTLNSTYVIATYRIAPKETKTANSRRNRVAIR